MRRLVGFFLIACMIIFSLGISKAETASTKGYGFIDRDGNVVIEPQFQYASKFCSGRACIFTGTMTSSNLPKDGLYGYIDSDGKEIIPLIYEKARDFNNNGLASVCKNGKYGIIDTDGNTVVDFTYDYIDYSEANHLFRAFNGTLTLPFKHPSSGTYHILDDDGIEKWNKKCDGLDMCDGYIKIKKNDKYAVYSLDGKKRTDYVFKSLDNLSDSLICFQKSGGKKYGYIDINGKVIIKPQYDKAYPFVDGRALVKNAETYYIIDKSGNTTKTLKADYIDPQYDSGYTYAFEGALDGSSPKEGKYYLMDIDGNYISRGYFGDKDRRRVSDGYWCVKEGKTWYALDMNGNEVFSVPDCESLTHCKSGRYIAKKNGLAALLDENGVNLTDYVWETISPTDISLISVYSTGDAADFRKVRWGMSEEEVKAIEGNNPSYSDKLDGRNARYIGYETTLMGNDVLLVYYFGSNGLYAARYAWLEEHNNDSLYISDYDNVRTQLTNKYGSPSYDNEIWDNSSHKNYYSDNKGQALSFGYLSYITSYKTNRTKISMKMSADNYDVTFLIDYESTSIAAPSADYSDQL